MIIRPFRSILFDVGRPTSRSKRRTNGELVARECLIRHCFLRQTNGVGVGRSLCHIGARTREREIRGEQFTARDVVLNLTNSLYRFETEFESFHAGHSTSAAS